jgi:Spherulation-specific family 4
MLGRNQRALITAALVILLLSVLSFSLIPHSTSASNNVPRAVIPSTTGHSNATLTAAASAIDIGKVSIVPTTTVPATIVPITTVPATMPSGSAAAVGRPNSAVPTTGVIIPLYSYPGPEWDVVVQAKLAHPSVPIVAVINPSNGPGDAQDQNYVSGVDKLRSAGITVLGYVHTSYAARNASSVLADVNSYKAWYAVNGIFFDEMSNVAGSESYYASLSDHAKSIGLTFTVGNPGAGVPASFIGTVDCIVVYESQGLPSSSSLAAWTMGMTKGNFAIMAYGVDQLNIPSTRDLSGNAAYIYVTDSSLPNPYGTLPGYFAGLVSALDNVAPTSQF